MSGDGADRLGAGREALRGHAWLQAFEALDAADTAEPLPPTDLELLGEAALKGLSEPLEIVTLGWR